MKCHLEQTPDVPNRVRYAFINVLVETDATYAERAQGWEDANEYQQAAYEFLTRHGAEHGVEWFEDPSLIRFRMVKHPVGNAYSCVAVVPFMAKVVS